MMKTQLMTLGVLSLLVAATACSNHREADEPSGLARTVQFHAGVPASKTAFGEADGDSYPTYWTANDTRVKISLNAGEAAEAVVTPSSDGRTADFETEVDPSSAPAPYRFYAVSPASAAEAMSPSRKAGFRLSRRLWRDPWTRLRRFSLPNRPPSRPCLLR